MMPPQHKVFNDLKDLNDFKVLKEKPSPQPLQRQASRLPRDLIADDIRSSADLKDPNKTARETLLPTLKTLRTLKTLIKWHVRNPPNVKFRLNSPVCRCRRGFCSYLCGTTGPKTRL